MIKKLKQEYDVKWYLKTINNLLKYSPKEETFQNIIVYPILDNILKQNNNSFNVIDTHNFAQNNTRKHDRSGYSVLTKAVPDLIVAKNFTYENRNKNKIEVKAAIEVKCPTSKEIKINDNEYIFVDDLYTQLLPTLIKNGKMILTNFKNWFFFEYNEDNKYEMEENTKNNIDIYMCLLQICGIDCPKYEGEEIKSKVNEINEFLKNKNLIDKCHPNLEKINKIEFKKFIKEVISKVEEKYKIDIQEFVNCCMEKEIIEFDISNASNQINNEEYENLISKLENFLK